MTNSIPFSKLLMLLLAISVVSFSSCEDDDDVLGLDFNDDGTLFMSSNTTGVVGVLDTRDNDNRQIFTFPAAGTDSDGLFFDESGEGFLYQVNRSDNTLVQYKDVLDNIDDTDQDVELNLTSPANNFSNGRGLAEIGLGLFLVANDDSDDDDDDNENSLALFSNTNGDAITYVKNIRIPFNVWGIQADGSTLYAVVDNSDSIAVFTDIIDVADDAMATPTRYIKVEGIGRTHGLEFFNNTMVLTDIGDAGSATDGAIVIIKNFSALTGPTITAADYTRIAGDATGLGNPVDVAWDEDNNDIYVAERANMGGRILSWDLDDEGNAAPRSAGAFAGISSVYINND